MNREIRPEKPHKVPTERPNTVAIIVRFLVIAAAVLAVVIFALKR